MAAGALNGSAELTALADASDMIIVLDDLTTAVGCQTLVDQAVTRFGGIDLLVNNVGGVHPRTPLPINPTLTGTCTFRSRRRTRRNRHPPARRNLLPGLGDRPQRSRNGLRRALLRDWSYRARPNGGSALALVAEHRLVLDEWLGLRRCCRHRDRDGQRRLRCRFRLWWFWSPSGVVATSLF